MSEKQKQAIRKAVPRWYKKMAFWKVATLILAPIASGELLLFFTKFELPTWVHITVGVCAVISFYIKLFVKDEDGDGVVD